MHYIGFTGSRSGMSDAQRETVTRLLRDAAPKIIRHGDAIGSDEQFHVLARMTEAKIVVHPCNLTDQRAYCQADEVKEAKAPLARNKDIVDNSTVVIATPDRADEQVRSGTWSTIRYARKEGKIVHVVTPDGSVLSTAAI